MEYYIILMDLASRIIQTWFRKKLYSPYTSVGKRYMEYKYNLINNTDPPLDKQKYFNSYKEKHDKIFSCWHYKVIEKICIFEYNNITTQKRNWSIDDITKDNWQTFLQENLCLTSYH